MGGTLALVENVGSSKWNGLSLGCLYLATWVRHYDASWDVCIVDGRWEDTTQHFKTHQYDVVGISAMTNQYESACALAETIQHGRVVLGGPHITSCPESLRPCFDDYIQGEGEDQLLHLLRGEPVSAPLLDLADYPDLDYSLLSTNYWKSRVTYSWQDVAITGAILTGRGCPYRCRFCSTSLFWGKPRFHSPEWVIRQLQALVGLGCTHVSFCDDLFTVNKARLHRIAERFEQAGLRKQIKEVFACGRANLMDEETCDLLRSMNVSLVHFGFESGDDRMVRYLKKTGASVAMNKQAVRLCRSKGLQPVGSLMLGNPTETPWQMLKTAWFILWCFAHGVKDLMLITASPLPGTEFWQIAKAKKRVSDKMNFNGLELHYWKPGQALMIDIPRWQFIILFYLGQLAMVTLKGRKAVTILRAALGRMFRYKN
jgi:radical SAM superfamily enzyme YgiQ (UPF0313 family)